MLIEIQSLKLQLGGVPILQDVGLTLREGEIFGLLGPNGAGKSTTIAAVLGLVRADGGTIRILGEDPIRQAKAIHRRLGVVPERNGFYDWMTAVDYLCFFSRLYGKERSIKDLEARLVEVGLEPRPRQTIGTFSHGMRQRLGLARALIGDPDLLILDEPTNGLDPRGRREIHDILINFIAHKGAGILLCTHLLDDVERLCKRIGIIVNGRTVAEGEIAELIRRSGNLTRFRLRLAGAIPSGGDRRLAQITVVAHEGEWCVVDIDPAITPAAAWSGLLFAGWPVTEIHREGGGLDDLYLSLTERREV